MAKNNMCPYIYHMISFLFILFECYKNRIYEKEYKEKGLFKNQF